MIMSPDNNIGAKHGGGGGGGGNKDEANQSSGGGGGGRKTSSLRPPEQALKCPRCDSPNTKFCYYNNYSLTQPRHFCKTCRRYWTKGGALRNVPIGGGCRKNKKALKSSSSSRFSGGDSSSKDSSSDIGGLKFFNGLSPAMDFQLGGLNFPPRFHQSSSFGSIGSTGINGVYNNNSTTTSTFGETSSPNCFNLDPLGLNNFPLSSHLMSFKQGGGGGDDGGDQHGFQEMGIANNSNINLLHNNGSTNSIASSIESLSSINQDLHWKLQQQRLAMLFGGGGGGSGGGGGGENQRQKETLSSPIGSSLEKPQPILFQNLEISKPTAQPMGGNFSRKDGGVGGNLATEWFFDNPYAPVNMNMNPTGPTDDRNVTSARNENGSNWSGIQAWSNLNQFTLP